MMNNEMKEKEEVIKELKHLWGPIFIKSYIPMYQRPLSCDVNRLRHWYEWRPRSWDLPVLKAILAIAKLTSDKRQVRAAVEDVVNHRIKSTEDHVSHVTVADCEVIGIMLDKHWGTEFAFKMYQENSLIDQKEQDRSGEESKHKIDINQVFDDDSDVDPKSKEARSDVNKKAGHEFGANPKQRGTSEASGKAHPKGNHTQKNAAETSSSVPRGEKQKKRNHAAIEDELSGMNSSSTCRSNLAIDHAPGHECTGNDSYSSSSSPLQGTPSPPRSSATKLINRNISRYGMFPPPPPARSTTPPVRNTPMTRHNKGNVRVKSGKYTIDLTISPTDDRKDDANSHFEHNDTDDNEEEDEDEDHNIFNAKLAAAEAAFNLAQLRVAAARKAKKARTAGSSRGNSTSSS